MTKLCDECETVAHCMKHGCIPKINFWKDYEPEPTRPAPVTKDEALDLALEALESCGAGHITDGGNQWHDEKLVDKAITAIKQARSAPVQEPVAWRFTGIAGFKRFVTDAQYKAFLPEVRTWYEPFKCESCTTPPAAPVQPIGYVKLIDTPFGKKLKPVLTVAVPVGAKLYTTPPAAEKGQP